MMRCFVSLVLPRPQSNVNMRPERIAIPSALSLLLFRTSIFNNKSKTVWYLCICMVCCDCKKSFCALQNEAEGVAYDREWSEPIHIIGQFLALALLNRGLKYISTTTLFRRIYSVSSSESAKTPTIHVERIAVRQFPYINKQLTFLTNFCCCDHQEFFLLGVIFLSYK